MTFCLVSMFLRKQVRNNNRQKARKEASNSHNGNGSWEVDGDSGPSSAVKALENQN